MTVHVNDRYMEVSEKEGVVMLRWKSQTTYLTDDEFKKEATKFINVAKKMKSKKIIVDMRQFHYILTPEVTNWRHENVIKAYNEIGVEKFAFISQQPTVKQNDPANTFVTQYFPTREEAEDWLRS